MKNFKKMVLAAVVIIGGIAAVPAQEVYFTVDEMPNIIKCLPAPPDTGSAQFAYDKARYAWGKQQRLNPERAAIARGDAVWGYDALLKQMSGAFGMNISEAETPEIWKLMTTSLSTTDQIRVAPKKHYMRQRPFLYYHEHLLTYQAEEDEEELGREGSYPSGHTARGWAAALLLAEINPARADTIFARGWMYGESRVIVGAHWQSDVDASRVVASIGYSQLHNSAAFREQMARAKAEFAAKSGHAMARTNDNSDFVNITDVIPDAILEIRYHSTYNFVGSRIDGYDEPTALLTRRAAEALKAVSDDLKAQGYRLKIFDAYRPQRAVDHFMRWAQDIDATEMKQYFYPDLNKNVLIPDYIARKSGHTRGSTVDLTLFDMRTEREVDMGGTFDWFGPESHPDFGGNPDKAKYTGAKSPRGRSITSKQFHNRMILRQAMMRHGFKPLDTEWWHFTLKDEPYPSTYFTFPVKKIVR